MSSVTKHLSEPCKFSNLPPSWRSLLQEGRFQFEGNPYRAVLFKEGNGLMATGMITTRGDDLKSEYKGKPPAWRKN